MISKAIYALVLLLALAFVAFADDSSAIIEPIDPNNCEDKIQDGSCNVFKDFCGQPNYLKETNLCMRSCGLCPEKVDLPEILN